MKAKKNAGGQPVASTRTPLRRDPGRFPYEYRPVYARLGQVATPISDNRTGDRGLIVGIGPELCQVEFEDGNIEAFPWRDVELNGVEPDPADVAAWLAKHGDNLAERASNRAMAD